MLTEGLAGDLTGLSKGDDHKHASELHSCKNSATQGKQLVAANPARPDGLQQCAQV